MDQTSTPNAGAKPKLKLKMSTSNVPTVASMALGPQNGNIATPTITDSPSTATSHKIKLKLPGKSQPSTPAAESSQPILGHGRPPTSAPTPAIKTKSGRVMKPTAKKRAKDDVVSGDDEVAPSPAVKRVKLNAKTPSSPSGGKLVKVRVKNKGHAPFHPPGDGYDSELEEREADPVIEEQFIMRYEGGVPEDLDYLTQMVEQGRIGEPTAANANNKDKAPAQFGLKWLAPYGDKAEREYRRALVRIRTNLYAAVLVDLPTITESMKSFNKKDFMKTADICQMLLIFRKVKDEAEAKTTTLPPIVDKDYKWPHGITPPLHDVYNRRFRPRLSKKEVQDKEAEVARLIAADAAAASTRYEIVTIGDDGKEQQPISEHDDEQDAEGEDDEDATAVGDGLFGGADLADDDNLDMQDQLEAMLDADEGETQEASAAETPVATQTGAPTPAEESDDDDDGDDDDDSEDADEAAEAEAADREDDNETILSARMAIEQIQAKMKTVKATVLVDRLEKQLKIAQKHLDSLLAARDAAAEGAEGEESEEE